MWQLVIDMSHCSPTIPLSTLLYPDSPDCPRGFPFMFKRIFKQVSIGVALSAAALTAHAVDITGAGASFPYPAYAKWAAKYHEEVGHRINYQSIGSGGGQQQIIAKTVDFGASDDPMKADAL